jgi:O-succinylbenzoate synthase
MGAHLAALLNSEYASGLATAALLTQDVTDTPLIPVDGMIPVGRVAVRRTSLDMTDAPVERTTWWIDRLTRNLVKF